MSHPFFQKYTVTLTSPIIFGEVSTHAASAVWGGPSGTKPGVIGPAAPIGRGESIPGDAPGPVDPNYPDDPPPPATPPTPVQTVEDGDVPNASVTTNRNVQLSFEVLATGDFPEGTTTGIIINAWANGDQAEGARDIRANCTVNGVAAAIVFDETIGVTGWRIEGVDIPDGTPLDIKIAGTAQTVSPPDLLTGFRDIGPASDFSLSLTGVSSGGGASGTMDAFGGKWNVHEAADGPSGPGSGVSDTGGPGGVDPTGETGGSTGGSSGGSSWPLGPYELEFVGSYSRFGWAREPRFFPDGNGGGVIIIETNNNNDFYGGLQNPPGHDTWVWSGIFVGYAPDGNPIYTEGWVWQPFFSVGGLIYDLWYVGTPSDPASPDYVQTDVGEIDLGGPVVLDGVEEDDLPGELKDGTIPANGGTPPPYTPSDLEPITPDVTTPRTVPIKPQQTVPLVGADDLPMDEYYMKGDVVIQTTVSAGNPTEITDNDTSDLNYIDPTNSVAPITKRVLLDHTGFTFVSGTSFQIDETVRFKYLPLKARVEDQPTTEHGFYTPVVGPFTGARFREMAGDTNAKVELYWAGPQQPFFLFRKMPDRMNPLATSTLAFKDMATEESARTVTIHWSVDLPVPFGMGYEWNAGSLPGSILQRKMQSPNEPHMKDKLNITRYDFSAKPKMEWRYDRRYKSMPSNGGKVIAWDAEVVHAISFEPG